MLLRWSWTLKKYFNINNLNCFPHSNVAVDGQHLYLHSLNVRCLIREYGSFAQCPETITAKVVEVEHMSMNEVTIKCACQLLLYLWRV